MEARDGNSFEKVHLRRVVFITLISLAIDLPMIIAAS